VLDIGPLDRAVSASTLDSLGIEEYSLCSAIGVGIADPDSEAVGGCLAKEGKRDGGLGGGQSRSRLRLLALPFICGGLLPCAQGRDEGLGLLVIDD
jgi:hypothetical protein